MTHPTSILDHLRFQLAIAEAQLKAHPKRESTIREHQRLSRLLKEEEAKALKAWRNP